MLTSPQLEAKNGDTLLERQLVLTFWDSNFKSTQRTFILERASPLASNSFSDFLARNTQKAVNTIVG